MAAKLCEIIRNNKAEIYVKKFDEIAVKTDNKLLLSLFRNPSDTIYNKNADKILSAPI